MRIAGSVSERDEQQRQTERVYVEKCVAATKQMGAQRMGRRVVHTFEIRSQNGICNIVIAIRDYSFCVIDARTSTAQRRHRQRASLMVMAVLELSSIEHRSSENSF